MATRVYIVIQSRGAWWVDLEGKPCGPCATRDEALHTAHQLVDLVEMGLDPVEIWAPDENGRQHLEWESRRMAAE